MKKIFITNDDGQDSFAKAIAKYIPTFKYSSIDSVKDILEVAGVMREPKTEEKRLLYSDIKDRLTKYDDIPFRDITSIVADFNNDLIDTDVLLIDIREPEEIKRAVKTIDSNHADRDVENYNYDYIIENDGTLEQLEKIAKIFVNDVIYENCIPDNHKPLVLVCSKY